MQAIILAGGYGTRLYPLTLDAPKPMISLGNRPMIEYLIDKLDALGTISDIFIVTNGKFAHVFDTWRRGTGRNDIQIVNDMTLSNEDRLGSLGDIQFVIDHYDITENVIILGGDNFFEDDLSEIIQEFEKKGDIIALYDIGNLQSVKQLSTLTMDRDNKILEFIEKPENPTSTLCSTLIYIFQHQTLSHIGKVIQSGQSDRAGDLIAHLCSVQSIYGHVLTKKWFDIGSMEQLHNAEAWLTTQEENSSTSQAQKDLSE